MTPWECVGEFVVHITKYREEWKLIAQNGTAPEKGNNKHTIASYLSSYLDEPMIMARVFFLRVYYHS